MHAYNKEGETRYEVIGANGKKRPTRVSDMIKNGWYPSVSEIERAVIRQDHLDRWLREELVGWCADNPRTNESKEDYVARALEEGQVSGKKARDFGNVFHDTAEAYALDRNTEIPIEVYEWWPHYKEWFDENIIEVIHVELPMTCRQFGVGGKTDAILVHKEHGLIMEDTKTQKVKWTTTKTPYKKITYYDKWIQQLALYSAMYDINNQPEEDRDEWARQTMAEGLSCFAPKCLNVVVDSSEPGPVTEKLWEPEKTHWGLQLAVQCIKVWQLDKQYKPEGSIL